MILSNLASPTKIRKELSYTRPLNAWIYASQVEPEVRAAMKVMLIGEG